MNIEDTNSLLTKHMADNWNTTPVVWVNAPNNLTCDEYVRFSINYFTTENRTFGDNRITNDGSIAIQVFTPINTGTGRSDVIGQIAIDLFENQRFENVLTYAGLYQHIGKDIDDSNLFMAICQIPFQSV